MRIVTTPKIALALMFVSAVCRKGRGSRGDLPKLLHYVFYEEGWRAGIAGIGPVLPYEEVGLLYGVVEIAPSRG